MFRMETGVNMILEHLGLTMPVVPLPPAFAQSSAFPTVAVPVATSDPYIYRPLATDKPEIRTLESTSP